LGGDKNDGHEGIDMGPVMQHYMNPLHIYCRLKDLGVPKNIAKYLCRIYESGIYGRLSRNSLDDDFKQGKLK
jgi:hypothetical protein